MIVDKLIERSLELKNPMTVLLDATLEDLPKEIVDTELGARWATPKAAAEALYDFNCRVIDMLSSMVPAVTISLASHLLYGAPGVVAYRDTIKAAQDAGLIVIADTCFSGGINGSEYLSASHLGTTDIGRLKQPMFDVDFVTYNPFSATGGIDPFIADAKKFDKGIFVVVRMPDKGLSVFQDLQVGTSNNQSLWESILHHVNLWGKGSNTEGGSGYNRIGAILGLRHQSNLSYVRKEYPNTFFYVPGNSGFHAPAFNDRKGAIVECNTAIKAHRDPTHEGLNWIDSIGEHVSYARSKLRESLGGI